MNKILKRIIEERQGHYCHVIEVDSVIALESIIESVISDFSPKNEPEYTEAEFIEFFESMEIYYLPEGEENKIEEEKIYKFNFRNYIQGTLD